MTMKCMPPITPFYVEKLGFAGVHLFFSLIFAPKVVGAR